MGVNDVYELTVHQLDRSQAVENVFFYHQELAFVTSFSTTAQVLAQNFAAQILPKVSACQPEEILTKGLTVKNLFNAADSYDLLLSIPGGFTTDRQLESTFNAIGFKLNGDNAAVKNGAKRIGGVFEDYVDDGVITGATLITACNDLADAFEDYVTVGTIIQDNVFAPVIVKRIRSGVKGAYKYRLPETTLESTLSKVIVAIFNVVVTSQLSRKIGDGI